MKKGARKTQGEKTPDLIERKTRTEEKKKKSQWIIHEVENHQPITHIKRRTRINLWPAGRRERKNKKDVASELASISDTPTILQPIFREEIVFCFQHPDKRYVMSKYLFVVV